ncbi:MULTISPECIES: 30S ribosomal protein S3 [Thermodesulfobacterium]|uniref:Small ribosomal subunit protein uS3 n=2 Tax=Thermodesulfobacterium commune TaxID=1741 RepID=A0A075WZV2_9BACT|nr:MULTISPECIES: 30S ribosomal protein S3 [Thermodesulfobacterium]KUJ98143.1 MAG: 30S ribosomal protein S3 [Thermodesulfobacterium sp. 37_54]KUK19789.1 MAG: 30S ribosomal protein S3 [Thermodesulfobacterium commune]AIH04232.1 30S ribosomal protein S3 [Thermodesulfobacterium commune DSM 2178]KUK37870.1 MAG: 30S ribosomal protein S3 [Thermodesulfobacterium commune]MBZ4682234.1 ribosomal protein [Thermodesulfobacterium sp.]
MGQKVNPIGLRIGITRTWDSRWFAKPSEFPKYVYEDYLIRKFLKEKYFHAGISKIEIERAANKVRVIIYSARPGIVIGKKGAEIEKIKNELGKLIKEREFEVLVNEVRRPELEAQLVAENIATQIERRVSFRRAMKRAVSLVMRFGAQGVKVQCSGRLGGAEIARSEWYRVGRVPLSTLRADIDYGFATAVTKYGSIGVKVWIFKGEVLPEKEGQERLVI